MDLAYHETRAEAVCSLEKNVIVLLNDESRMKGKLYVRFREKLKVKVLLPAQQIGKKKSFLLDFIYYFKFKKILDVKFYKIYYLL